MIVICPHCQLLHPGDPPEQARAWMARHLTVCPWARRTEDAWSRC
jgi:hypothetical protein